MSVVCPDLFVKRVSMSKDVWQYHNCPCKQLCCSVQGIGNFLLWTEHPVSWYWNIVCILQSISVVPVIGMSILQQEIWASLPFWAPTLHDVKAAHIHMGYHCPVRWMLIRCMPVDKRLAFAMTTWLMNILYKHHANRWNQPCTGSWLEIVFCMHFMLPSNFVAGGDLWHSDTREEGDQRGKIHK